MTAHPIRTERLDLVPLPQPLLAALLAGDLHEAGRRAPFPVQAATFAGDGYVLRLRHDQLVADPSALPWLYRAAVLRSTGEVVARAGFHAPPDQDGTVEIGYSVEPRWRRQGLALEMAGALLGWATARGAKRCLASVRPDNAASLATVGRLGFVRTGEHLDEIDGLEHVFTLELPVAPDDGALLGRPRAR